ncbi:MULTISPECIES: hypothetical protein [unclassified Microcoleus]|uniref:hypothetical protein n=1 Tax=unclassified Microcoleus TaxID=2642155 RepID=UPI002FD6590C
MPIFLYVRAIELLLFYFNVSAQVRSKKNITLRKSVSESEIIEPRRHEGHEGREKKKM